MGCTSSAPKTLSATPSKEDKSIQFEEEREENLSRPIEAIATEIENRTEINVLPPSETTEPVQLVRNNQSTSSLKSEKDLYTNGNIVDAEIIDSNGQTENADNDDSKLKLEAVVGKFFEIVQQDTSNVNDGAESEESAETKEVDKETNEMEKTESNDKDDSGEHGISLVDIEEVSPSQSQCSRATRWEALADIAAELPPSLAVDPLTGQIYSLSK